jgi:chlorobactene glucosyltransferase
MIIFILILVTVLISTIVVVYNYFTAPILKGNQHTITQSDLVSVLIPARNEENNIRSCLENIIRQDYKNMEILVLDDQSTDRTNEIIKWYSQNHRNVFCVDGEPLPQNWTGKNWACYQLSRKAKGNFFLFVDADVVLANNAASSALNVMSTKDIKMLSVFPTQKIKSFGEWLIVPLMNWLLLSFLPLSKVYESSNSSFIAANGQFMMWDRTTYFAIGGHHELSNTVVEDMELARRTKQNNKIITLLGGKMVFCRMYKNISDAFKGFSKNFYPGFNLSPGIFIGLVLLLFTAFAASSLLAMLNSEYLIIVSLIVLCRILISLLSCQNIFLNVILHPLQMIFMLIIGFNSVLSTKLRYIVWKERKL